MSGVKNVNGLANMFAQAIGFNQDLSTWNVLKVPSRPYEFDSGLTTTWTLPRPKWGTDGKPIIVPPIVPYDSNSFNVLIEQTETQSPTNVDITLTLNPDARDWEVWIGNEMIASPYYAKAPVTVSNKSITIPNNNNRTQIAVKGSMSTVTLLMASPLTYTSLDKITTNVINYSPTINSYRFTVKESALTVPDTLPSHITSLSEMFKECTNILSDISGWDTSNILYATRMLNGATNFNQDLSGWNVFNIKSKPTSFDDYCNSWTLPRPIWGTTGVGEVIEYDDTGAFKFTVNGPINDSELRIQMYDPNPDWVLLRDGNVVGGGLQGNGSSITFANTDKTSSEYALIGSDFVTTLNEGGWSAAVGSIEVTQFPSKTVAVRFGLGGIPFTVPTTLPKNITTLGSMFSGCTKFNQDISMWDISHVTELYEVFKDCTSFNQPLNTWDVSNSPELRGMFQGASVFNQPLDNWNVGLVTNVSDMFRSASKFNQDISSWNVSNVTNMSSMFSYAKAFNQDLSTWNVLNISTKPEYFDSMTSAWVLPRPTWGPTIDCTGATENVKLNISGGVSDLRYKVEINGHVFNEDGGVDISTGWHTVAPALYFMCEDNGDNTLTMTVYEDNALNTLPVKLTPISHLTTATITGGDTVANPTFKYDEGTSSISFCVITEWAA